MTRFKHIATILAAGALLVPTTASASDAEIQDIIRDGATKVAAAEKRAEDAGAAVKKQPTRRNVQRFRAAARAEERLAFEIRGRLVNALADTEDVSKGRDLIADGLQIVARALDRVDKALGRAARGQRTAATRALDKAVKEIAEGNALIDQGEPLVGAQLTAG